MNLNDVWNQCLQMLEAEVKPITFRSWIQPIKPYLLGEDKILLTVENDPSKAMIEARFVEMIRSALFSATQTIFDIEVKVVTPDEQPEWEKEEPKKKEAPNQLVPFSANPKYTFENFVVGNSNRYAHAASFAVAEAPAEAYNPLFLYGGSGLGKTHLMHAIANYVKANHPDLSVIYVSSEKFTNDLINAIRDDKRNEFRQQYRTADVLLVDDVQFIGGKESTQEEFFHTFNELHDANKQIVLTSDRHPKEINTLEDRLRSRFEWGLVGDIQPPDYETRIAILKKKAEADQVYIPNTIYSFIADRVKSNIRELEGAMLRIITYAKISGREITVDLANEALKQFSQDGGSSQVTAKIIKEKTAKYFNLMESNLTGKVKTKNIALARQIAMYLCREMTNLSYPAIGGEFGGRDHTTVLYAVNKIENDMHKDEELKKDIDALMKDIRSI
jgi:chromosomal replication initiator protein